MPGGTSGDGVVAQALVIVPGSVSSNNTAAAGVVDGIRASFSRVGAPPGLRLYLTGQLAANVDSFHTESSRIANLTMLFVIVVLFVVYRAALAPLVTLIPAALSVLISGPLIALTMGPLGVAVPPSTQPLMIVLLLGAGTDYGLFLVFRFREEMGNGLEPREALVAAVERVGRAVAYSALIVVAALLSMLVAPSAIYRGLGTSLAIAVAVMLVAALTLMPALLAIFGRAVFWPASPRPGQAGARHWPGAQAQPNVTSSAATYAMRWLNEIS